MADESLSVLCPALYATLQRIFGRVIVANAGKPLRGSVHTRLGTTVFSIAEFGEAYRVNCPFCGDQRQRLWVNHSYGQPDPGQPQYSMKTLAVCYNEGCLKRPENRDRFYALLFGALGHSRKPSLVLRQPMLPAATNSGVLPERLPPANTVPIQSLPADHPAVVYLTRERKFPLPLLVAYDVGYCTEGVYPYRMAGQRVIIPIRMRGVCVGWQGRAVPPVTAGVPKYYTCPGMPKSSILYNYDAAVQQPYVVVVEGITDVWGAGDAAVALLGKSVSPQQRNLLHTGWSGRPIIIMLDADAAESAEAAVTALRDSGKNPVISVRLPDGYDPGDYCRDEITLIVHNALRHAGIALAVV